jgi:hypothetical protein
VEFKRKFYKQHTIFSTNDRPTEVLSFQFKRTNPNSLRKSSRKERALIADFLELPISEDPAKQSHPLSMKQVVEKAWANWGIDQEKSPEQVLSENWQKIVGRKFSGKCAPERLTENTGTLFIKTASGPIKQELGFEKKQIIERIQTLEGCSFVKELKIN